MGRVAQPRELAELKGATQKDPQRYKNTPPKSEMPLGDAPELLSDGAKACWFEISGLAIPGVLTGADRIILEMASNLLSEYRADPVKFPIGKLAHIRGVFAEMGMGPSSRGKLGIDKPKDKEDSFETL